MMENIIWHDSNKTLWEFGVVNINIMKSIIAIFDFILLSGFLSHNYQIMEIEYSRKMVWLLFLSDEPFPYNRALNIGMILKFVLF